MHYLSLILLVMIVLNLSDITSSFVPARTVVIIISICIINILVVWHNQDPSKKTCFYKHKHDIMNFLNHTQHDII